MNPDVPGLEACKRLNWPTLDGYAWWWAVGPLDEHGLVRCDRYARVLNLVYVRAPTIGEMGEEIRRRGWGLICTLERRDDGAQVWSATLPGRGHAIHEREADARALALAEALVKEGKA